MDRASSRAPALFVEGETRVSRGFQPNESLDVSVLERLQEDIGISVEALGPAYSLRNVARSLFQSREKALENLVNAREFDAYRDKVGVATSEKNIEKKFNCQLEEMTGGREPLEFGSGKWLQLLRGKKILSEVVNSSCFDTSRIDAESHYRGRVTRVVLELLGKELQNQPEDFKQLIALLENLPHSSPRPRPRALTEPTA